MIKVTYFHGQGFTEYSKTFPNILEAMKTEGDKILDAKIDTSYDGISTLPKCEKCNIHVTRLDLHNQVEHSS